MSGSVLQCIDRLVYERQLKSVTVLMYMIAIHNVFALHAQRTRLELACD